MIALCEAESARLADSTDERQGCIIFKDPDMRDCEAMARGRVPYEITITNHVLQERRVLLGQAIGWERDGLPWDVDTSERPGQIGLIELYDDSHLLAPNFIVSVPKTYRK